MLIKSLLCLWRLQINISCLPLLFSILYIKSGSLHLNQSFTDLSSLATQMPSSTLHLSGGWGSQFLSDESTSSDRTFTHRASSCTFLLLLLLKIIQIYSCLFVPVYLQTPTCYWVAFSQYTKLTKLCFYVTLKSFVRISLSNFSMEMKFCFLTNRIRGSD